MKIANPNGYSDSMRELAGLLQSTVRAINHRDPNVFSDNGKADSAFRESIKFQRNGLESEVRSNGSCFVLQCKVVLDAGVWSVNQKDNIMLTRRTDAGPASAAQWPLFVAGNVPERGKAIWQSESFRKLLADLKLAPGEGLHFYKNAVAFYARNEPISSFVKRSDFVLSFLYSVSTNGNHGKNRVVMPEQFYDLEDIAQRWAISDDSTRADALDTATKSEREELVRRIMSRIDAINAFLAEHDDGPATSLGALAETASEAKISLDAVKH